MLAIHREAIEFGIHGSQSSLRHFKYHMSMASCTNGSMAEHLNESAIEVMYLPLNGLI